MVLRLEYASPGTTTTMASALATSALLVAERKATLAVIVTTSPAIAIALTVVNCNIVFNM